MTEARAIWVERAWLPRAAGTDASASSARGGWQQGVQLDVDVRGQWAAIAAGVPRPAASTSMEVIDAPVIAPLVNAHSHAFQRSFVGLTEQRQGGHDDFWSWRDRMYAEALTVGPERLQSVATRLYRELLAGGYTQVCEFHYLHRDVDGRAYANAATMCMALVAAAQAAGIGLTLLPVVYERAGFHTASLRDDQRRFAASLDEALALRDAVRGEARKLAPNNASMNLVAGLALHSLRAVRADSLRRVSALTHGDDGPVHIHVAEQTAEVEDCQAATGLRPVAWLTQHAALDARWHLVHATHVTADEIQAVKTTGAGVVLCPSTEANLGDGLTDLEGWLSADVPLTIGSDSHVLRAWPEELRWLEYGQRLALRRRNVSAAPDRGEPSSAARLYGRMLAGSANAAGLNAWGLQTGARADLLVIDPKDPALQEVAMEHLLDAIVFAAPTRPFGRTMVGGRWIS